MGRPPKLTPHQRKEALERRARGEFLAEIARTYGVTHTTIARLIPNRAAPKTMAEARRASSQRAQQHATDLAPIIHEIRRAGVTTLWGIAARLDERGIPTRRGGKWHPIQVSRLLARLAK